MNERPASQEIEQQQPPVQIRRLSYPDLPQVIAIERRVFPTPWSLAMFVLELSKPTGVCLAAVRGDELVGYLICSRYDTVWHVDERRRRRRAPAQGRRLGAARGALPARSTTSDARFTLEVRPLQPRRDPPLRARGLPRGGHAPPLLPGQRRGRARDVAHARHARGLARGRAEPRSARSGESWRSRRAATTRARRCGRRTGVDALERDLLAERARSLRRRRAGDRLAPSPAS